MFELKQKLEAYRIYSKIQISPNGTIVWVPRRRILEISVGGDGANIDNSNHVVGAVLLFPVAFWEE